MTDIKQLLTEILGQHGWHEWDEQCCCGWPGERLTPSGRIQIDATCDEVNEHIADVLLSLPGIAIIELPEPDYTDEPEPGVKGYGFNGGPADAHIARERGVYAHAGLVYDQWDGVTAAQARAIASWWLAAANAAEDADD